MYMGGATKMISLFRRLRSTAGIVDRIVLKRMSDQITLGRRYYSAQLDVLQKICLQELYKLQERVRLEIIADVTK